ncbi:aldo/keto reductase [Microbacterium hominis]|uniref:Aldo/keto reductase n=1 Tax=Microbacterium hominis TaxID=162426 RepID=A0A7D4PP44_9MICO|nr:aldo/keto reductase [Microbacterium hominis]QKJ20530.1 aldo/keto reductase [Microbacterium hominis]
MHDRTLGSSDLVVSRIGLGCMSFGARYPGFNEWSLDEEAAAPVFRAAVEAGINLWDTANVYGGGTSEEIVGRAIDRFTRREDIILATKLFYPMGPGTTDSGLSRAAITAQVEASLRRLGTDYIDLYQIHRFDPAVPVEETMEALHQLVVSGKVRYLGASSMHAWQFSKLQYTARLGGWTEFISMQNHYSLLNREEEREMFALLEDLDVGSIVWSPLAQGRLARPHRTSTTRFDADRFGRAYFGDGDASIIDAVAQAASVRAVSMAQVAMAWVLARDVVASALIGVTRPEHLADAVEALDLQLTEEERTQLEAAYSHRAPAGY